MKSPRHQLDALRRHSFILTTLLISISSLPSVLSHTGLRSPARKLQHSFVTRPGCNGYAHITFEGSLIFQRPLSVKTPDECCLLCQQHKGCLAWEFRACCSHCGLWNQVRKIQQCNEGDCVAGIVDDDLYKEKLDEYVEIPREIFRGLDATCEERDHYANIASTLVACSEVRKQCNKASKSLDAVDIPRVEPACNYDQDVNYYGFDYNNGFIELTMTPRDCCRRCMRDRGCQAWTRLSSGQCWLKYRIPDESKWLVVKGDVSGTRIHFLTQCGTIMNNTYFSAFSDGEQAFVPANTTDDCCQACIKDRSCLVWSHFNTTCTIVRSYVNNRNDEAEGATSAFMITAPFECDGSTEPSVESLDIARAYDPDCASILTSGPGKAKDGCRGRRAATRIFNDAVKRMDSVT